MLPEKLEKHVVELKKFIECLLGQIPISYSDATPSSFPDTRGIYMISTFQGEVIRAGKTGRGNATFRNRLYHDHLMSSTGGNLPMQLVESGQCDNLKHAKEWIRKNCSARIFEVIDNSKRANLEHFMLAVLEPRFCDDNKSLKGSGDGCTG